MRLIPARLEQQSAVPQFEMRLESTLAEIGVVPKLLTPKRQLMQHFANQWLITKYEVLNHRLPANPRLTYGQKEVNPATTLHKTPPSQDANADRLARVHGAQVRAGTGRARVSCLREGLSDTHTHTHNSFLS